MNYCGKNLYLPRKKNSFTHISYGKSKLFIDLPKSCGLAGEEKQMRISRDKSNLQQRYQGQSHLSSNLKEKSYGYSGRERLFDLPK